MIAPQPFYTERGTPINVRAMVEELSASGCKIDLLVFPLGNDIQIPNVNIIRIPHFSFIKSLPIGFSFNKLFCDSLLTLHATYLAIKNRYDIYHGIEEAGVIAVILGKIFQGKSIYDVDSWIPDQLKSCNCFKSSVGSFIISTIEKIETLAMRKATAIISVCTSLTENAKLIAPLTPIYQIEDFPLDEAPVSQNDIDKLKLELGIRNERCLVYTGNLEGYQGVDLLLGAFKQAKIANCKLLIVGGPKNKALEFKDNFNDSSIIFTGPRPRDEMIIFQALADVLAAPRKEGCNTPMKIYCYMSEGKPIVATDIISHSTVLNNEVAFMAAPSIQGYADALKECFADFDEGRKRGSKARELAITRYSRKSFSEKLIAVYLSLA